MRLKRSTSDGTLSLSHTLSNDMAVAVCGKFDKLIKRNKHVQQWLFWWCTFYSINKCISNARFACEIQIFKLTFH